MLGGSFLLQVGVRVGGPTARISDWYQGSCRVNTPRPRSPSRQLDQGSTTIMLSPLPLVLALATVNLRS